MTEQTRTIDIAITPSSIGTRVIIDGREIKGVSALIVTASVDAPSQVTLDLIGYRVFINGTVLDTKSAYPPIFLPEDSTQQRHARQELDRLHGLA